MKLKKVNARLLNGDTIFSVDFRFAYINMIFEGDSFRTFLYGCPDEVAILKDGNDMSMIFNICGDEYICDALIKNTIWIDDGKMEIAFDNGEKISLKYAIDKKETA